MTLIPRPYLGHADMHKIQTTLAQWTQEAGDLGYIHRGDVAHRLGNGLRRFNPGDVLEIWEKPNGEILAFLLSYPNWGAFDLQTAPEVKGTSVHQDLISYAEQQAIMWGKRQNAAQKVIAMDVFSGDKLFIELLLENGYKHTRDLYRYTTQSLERGIAEPTLPGEFRIRPAEGEHEADQLAEVHRGAFNSKWTNEEYLQVMRSAGYNVENEWVVVAPDGRFAAFTVMWLDSITKSGLFEPVGTHQDFQRMGLGRALLYAGMQYMQAKGMKTAIVWHKAEDERSTQFYTSVGFTTKYTILDFVKPVGD